MPILWKALLSGAVLTLAATGAGRADPIPDNLLQADRQSCMSACTNYCNCSIQGIGNGLTLDEYKALTAAANNQQPAPQASVEKLKEITDKCRDETMQ